MDAEARLANSRTHSWQHPIGTVVTALLDAGLRLDCFHEHDAVTWRMFECLVRGEDRLCRWPEQPWLPLAIFARRDARRHLADRRPPRPGALRSGAAATVDGAARRWPQHRRPCCQAHPGFSTEDYAGLRAQALGLAEAAGLAPETRTIRPRGVWRHLAPALWPAPLRAVDAGRRGAAAARS